MPRILSGLSLRLAFFAWGGAAAATWAIGERWWFALLLAIWCTACALAALHAGGHPRRP
jgi:hypothetical protein